jgi:hypothetical protein
MYALSRILESAVNFTKSRLHEQHEHHSPNACLMRVKKHYL